MIKIKYLKTKNIIANLKDNGSAYMIEALSEGFDEPIITAYKLPRAEAPKLVYLKQEDIAPCGVSEKWIKDFSINNQIINGFSVKKSEYVGKAFSLWLLVNIGGEDVPELKDYELTPLEGVHHLQNIFIENTGLELKYNPA
jgi:hypothetical protein